MAKPQFSLHSAKIFVILFLTVISLFSLIAYLARFNTNIKRHFLIYMLTGVSISMFPSFNFSMFTEEDATTINNEDKKN